MTPKLQGYSNSNLSTCNVTCSASPQATSKSLYARLYVALIKTLSLWQAWRVHLFKKTVEADGGYSH